MQQWLNQEAPTSISRGSSHIFIKESTHPTIENIIGNIFLLIKKNPSDISIRGIINFLSNYIPVPAPFSSDVVDPMSLFSFDSEADSVFELSELLPEPPFGFVTHSGRGGTPGSGVDGVE